MPKNIVIIVIIIIWQNDNEQTKLLDSDGGLDTRVMHWILSEAREWYFELEAGSTDVVPLSVCEVALGDLVREADPSGSEFVRSRRATPSTTVQLHWPHAEWRRWGGHCVCTVCLAAGPLPAPRLCAPGGTTPCTPSTTLLQTGLYRADLSDQSTGRGDFSTNSLKIP